MDKLCKKPDDENEIAMKMSLSGDANREATLHVGLEEAGICCKYRMLVHALSRKLEVYIESLHWLFFSCTKIASSLKSSTDPIEADNEQGHKAQFGEGGRATVSKPTAPSATARKWFESGYPRSSGGFPRINIEQETYIRGYGRKFQGERGSTWRQKVVVVSGEF